MLGLDAIVEFLDSGGFVLWLIFAMALILWTFILERYWYLYKEHPKQVEALLNQWQQCDDSASWYADRIREALLSKIRLKLSTSLQLIQTLVALCPMLGLLGTVTGMVQVFEVMAITGTGNARAMASGVYMATIPTMAGLVVALSGFYFSIRLKHHVNRGVQTASELFV